MMPRSTLLTAILAMAALAGTAPAATFTLIPIVSARFDDAFNPLPFTPPMSGESVDDGPGIYEVDIYFRISDLAPNERGWANTSFDVMLMGDLTDAGGYAPDNPNPFYDINGGLPGGGVPKYSTNQDAGLAGDLQGILVSIAGGPMTALDPRKDLGKTSPSLLGSLFVRHTGMGQGEVTLKNIRYSLADHEGQFLPSQEAAGPMTCFSCNPGDPFPVILDQILTIRRPNLVSHTLAAATPAGELTWTLDDFSGPDAPFSPALDADSGVFTWNTQGAALGEYVAAVTVENEFGLTGTGTLTINVIIPEPSAALLAALGFGGLIAFRRRPC